MTRVLITGSRGWENREHIAFVLGALWQRYGDDLTIVHGAARGADSIAESICQARGIKTEQHPVTQAEWDAEPRKAAMLRNQRMVDSGVDLCVGFLLDGSPGTTAQIAMAQRAGVITRVYEERT